MAIRDHCRTPDKQPEAQALSIHKIFHNGPLELGRIVSYRAYLHEHRKRVLMLRCLATKGRATTTDPVMNFLEQLGDNGVIWTVLSFWPPPP